jgi:hypothetical protein
MSNWWTNLTRPGFKKKAPDAKPVDDPAVKKAETPDGLWIKCPETGELIYQPDLEAANFTCASAQRSASPLCLIRPAKISRFRKWSKTR